MLFVVVVHSIQSRSIADGQSQHSFSNHSHRGYLNSAFPSNLVNSRPGKLKYVFFSFCLLHPWKKKVVDDLSF